jgi:hypothetical protein
VQVEDLSVPTGRVVRHDHSVSRALNRGGDLDEGEQTEFLEDHGFLIEADKIWRVIDPMASYTLEYIDMIMSIRANNWRVLFVPTARLEFRITEFRWGGFALLLYTLVCVCVCQHRAPSAAHLSRQAKALATLMPRFVRPQTATGLINLIFPSVFYFARLASP